MAYTSQYIGSRYVPLFADPAEWNSTRTYEPLTIVLHEGNSFTSRQFVPVGIDINNNDYWVETGNYNAQVEAYRQEALNFANMANNKMYVSRDAMIADTKLQTGSFAEFTNGAIFIIGTGSTANGMDIVQLKNGNIASLAFTDHINVDWLGIPTDKDAAPYIQRAMDLAINTYVPIGTYPIYQSLKMNENHNLYGQDINKSILQACTTSPLVILANNRSSDFEISNLTFEGEKMSNYGIQFARTEHDSDIVDTHIRLNRLFFYDFVEYGIEIGNSGVGIAEVYLDTINVERSGGGYHLGQHMTDSTIFNCRVGGASKHHGFTVLGYNLEFHNCKSFYTTNGYAGIIFYYTANTMGDFECQDTDGPGVKFHHCSTINMNLTLDKCGNAETPTPSIQLINTSAFNIKAVVSNNEQSAQYNTARIVDIVDDTNLETNPNYHALTTDGVLNLVSRENIPIFDIDNINGRTRDINFITDNLRIKFNPTITDDAKAALPSTVTVFNDETLLVNGEVENDVNVFIFGSYNLNLPVYCTLPPCIVPENQPTAKPFFKIFFNQRTIVNELTQYDWINKEAQEITGYAIHISAGTYNHQLVPIGTELILPARTSN